ncbi:MAG: hypothetical protein WCS37_10805 [Chloroflexota bacterium]|nr:hypothetical protein [Chloroflexota bacterium]
MLKLGKFGILGVCLLIFGLITGNITPHTLVTRAAQVCPPTAVVDPTLATTALLEINKYRQSAVIYSVGISPVLGIPLSVGGLNNLPVSQNVNNSIGAQNHATYLANTPAEFGSAYEVAGNTCTTTQGDWAAKIAAKFANTTSPTDAIDQAINSVYLRLPLLDPLLQSVGLGYDSRYSVVDDTSPSNYLTFTSSLPAYFNGYIVGYPSAGTLIPVSTSFLPGEGITNTTAASKARTAGGIISGTNTIAGIQGDPLTNLNVPSTKVGYPVSIQFDPTYYKGLNIIGYNLQKAGAATPELVFLKSPTDIANVYSSLYSTVPTNSVSMLAAVMIPLNPLLGATLYSATFTFTTSSIVTPTGVTWSFVTGAAAPLPTATPLPPRTPGDGSEPGYDPITVPTITPLTPTPTPGLPGMPSLPTQGGPSSFYKPIPANGDNPAQFFRIWRRVDDPVENGLAGRSWLYGSLPYGFSILYENYDGSRRIVAYHDKARMEISLADSEYVSNGLLVRELISGNLQLGDTLFEPRTPSYQTIAGDPYELNPNTPTYAVFARVSSLYNDKRSPDRTGQQAIETITRDGSTNTNAGIAAYGVTYAYYDEELGHNVANRFWDFMNQSGLVLGDNYYNDQVFPWLSVMGLPLSEPYWVQATVGGQLKDVLVQVFERRVLTFTPSNSSAFQVEMANVGRAYYKWRYGQEP